MSIYFDNAATTKVSDKVANIVEKVMKDDFGNPSSLHMAGFDAEKYIKEAKAEIAKILKADDKEIFFTSGGTESNNLALIGAADANKRAGNKVLVSAIEHPSVKTTAKHLEDLGFDVIYLPVDEEGVVKMDALKDAMDDDTILVSVMHVNNEIGSIQPIDEIGEYIKSVNPKVVYHVDAIQSFGKLDVKPKNAKVDLLSVSGHKIHGPKGIGFLYIKNGTKINPIIFGGGQQEAMRSGTENVPGIAGLGAAAKDAYDNLDENAKKLTELKDYLIDKLSEMDGVQVNSKKGTDGAPHIVSASFKDVGSEVLLHALEDKGIFVSAGSACSSNKPAISYVLQAINLDEDLLKSTIRFSFNADNTKEEIDETVEALNELLPILKKYVRK